MNACMCKHGCFCTNITPNVLDFDQKKDVYIIFIIFVFSSEYTINESVQ